MKNSPKVPCVKVKIDPTSNYYVLPISELHALFDDLEATPVGESLILERFDMTQKELDNLPDFEGY